MSGNFTTSANNTLADSSTLYTNAYFLMNGLYVGIGLADFICNTMVSVAIIVSPMLRTRNEVCLVGAFTAADGLCGLSYASLGIRRLLLAATSEVRLLTSFQCMQTFPVNISVFALELMVLLLLSVSIDRIIFITNSGLHMDLGKLYLTFTIAIPALIAAASLVTVWVMVLQTTGPASFLPNCITNTFVPRAWYLFHNLLQILASSIAVAIYAAIMILIRFKKDKLSQFDAIKQRQIKRQRMLTKSLGLMAAASLIAFVIPNVLLTIVSQMVSSIYLQMLTQVLATIVAMHSLFTVVVYLSRPSDIRSEILKLMLCNLRNHVRPVVSNAASSAPSHNHMR